MSAVLRAIEKGARCRAEKARRPNRSAAMPTPIRYADYIAKLGLFPRSPGFKALRSTRPSLQAFRLQPIGAGHPANE
ncbi:hypothetical protein NRB_33890 [Novosphingobium sp. 11B]